MKQGKCGFTLIEIMVVLVIISITLTFTLLAFGDFGEKRQLIISSESFIRYVTLLEEKALLSSQSYGILFDKSRYTTLVYDNGWKPLTNQTLFKNKYFPNGSIITIHGQSLLRKKPTIIINPGYDVTPVTLFIGNKVSPKLIKISIAASGEIELTKPIESP